MKTFLSFLFLALVTGCTTHSHYEDTLSSWQGKTVEELTRKWGPPSTTASLSDGGKVYLYLVRNSEHIQIKKEDNVVPLFDCKTSFLIDQQDFVVGYKFEGHSCKLPKRLQK